MILNELPAHLQEILKNISWWNCKWRSCMSYSV